MAADDYAVVVGINRYAGLGELLGPENDASDFYDWLRDDLGGAVPEANIARLLGGELGGDGLRPRVGEIDDEFEKLHTGLQFGAAAGRTGRRLYVFLAGHGFDPEGTDAALLDARSTRRRVGDHISGRLYTLWFRKAALFDEIALFMDCCRDDYTGWAKRGPPWTEEIRPDPDIKTFTALATRWAFQARERPDPDRGNRVRGLFTRALLDTLEAGRVTGEELKRYTINGLAGLVREGEYQEPDIQTDAGIVFSEAADPPQGTLSVTASADRRGHTFCLYGPGGRLVECRPMNAEPWNHPDRDFGIYMLIDDDTKDGVQAEIVRSHVDVTF